MLDLRIDGATVIDGSGAPARTADVGIRDGRIVAVGKCGTAAREVIAAQGAWLTPGFIDLHTHYDGQASWDPTFSPSVQHGVTTVLMGNCGVGFAPLQPGNRSRAVAGLIALMEGVEDIPGAALAEGVRFDWESFPEYMAALDRLPHSLDFLVQVPHDPLRMAVMGERALAREAATAQDVADMRLLLRDALQAGAAGFSTGRTDNHRTAAGLATPASEASAVELTGIAAAFAGLRHGVLQVVSDFDLLQGPDGFTREFALVEQLALAARRPLSMTWLQRDPGGEQWRLIQAQVEAAVERGADLYLQTAPRGIGVIMGLDASFHPFMGFPGYKQLAHLPLAQRAAALREPDCRARILAERSERIAGDGSAVPPLVDLLLARIESIAARMFAMPARPDYAPDIASSLLAEARRRGCTALEVIYDHLTAGHGDNLIYFPIFNYNDGSLDTARQMLDHPRALLGLSDAGAHVGTICDASFSTFLLTHWVQGDTRQPLSRERAVQLLSSRNARHLGLTDRGVIAPGMRADLNLIDPDRLDVGTLRLVRDLPAGGRRFLQEGVGYLGTWVAGRCVRRDDCLTDARPGRLVRLS